jgi:hypothetical protein
MPNPPVPIAALMTVDPRTVATRACPKFVYATTAVDPANRMAVRTGGQDGHDATCASGWVTHEPFAFVASVTWLPS